MLTGSEKSDSVQTYRTGKDKKDLLIDYHFEH